MGNIIGKMATRSMTRMATNAAKTAATTAAVSVGTSMFTKAIGIDDTLMGKVMTAGVPAMVLAGGRDKDVSHRLFENSKKKDRKRPNNADEAEREFFNVFGDKAGGIAKAVSEETGASEKQVGGVLGMMLPDFESVVGEEDAKDGDGLMSMLAGEGEDEQRKNPSLARMAAKSLF